MSQTEKYVGRSLKRIWEEEPWLQAGCEEYVLLGKCRRDVDTCSLAHNLPQ